MKLYLGLIPKDEDYQQIMSVRDMIIDRFSIDDYRTNPILHSTISHYEADDFNLLFEYINNILEKVEFKDVTLEVLYFEIWENGKLAIMLDNSSLLSKIENIEKQTIKYCKNQEYRDGLKDLYGIDKETLGDHIKVLRNIPTKHNNEILKLGELKRIKSVKFDKLALFNSDYSNLRFFM